MRSGLFSSLKILYTNTILNEQKEQKDLKDLKKDLKDSNDSLDSQDSSDTNDSSSTGSGMFPSHKILYTNTILNEQKDLKDFLKKNLKDCFIYLHPSPQLE